MWLIHICAVDNSLNIMSSAYFTFNWNNVCGLAETTNVEFFTGALDVATGTPVNGFYYADTENGPNSKGLSMPTFPTYSPGTPLYGAWFWYDPGQDSNEFGLYASAGTNGDPATLTFINRITGNVNMRIFGTVTYHSVDVA